MILSGIFAHVSVVHHYIPCLAKFRRDDFDNGLDDVGIHYRILCRTKSKASLIRRITICIFLYIFIFVIDIHIKKYII